MKIKIFTATAVIVIMTAMVAIQHISVDYARSNLNDRSSDPAIMKRAEEEEKMLFKACEDEKAMLLRFSTGEGNLEEAEKQVKKNLLYALQHFKELKKGDRAELRITRRLSYSISFLYYAVLDSDYDDGYTHTEKERALWKTEIYRYASAANRYLSDCSSLTQEEADFREAEKLGKKIRTDINGQTSLYVKSLAEVTAEAVRKGWTQDRPA